MIAYVDASVALRVVLQQPHALAEANTLRTRVTSEITKVECLRVIDRVRLVERVSDEEVARAFAAARELLAASDIIGVTGQILESACRPLPVPLRTLDAVHLASALHYRDARAPGLVFATHDRRLSLAARAFGFPVIGA